MLPSREGGGYLREALILAFPYSVLPPDRHIMLLSAYFDESGTHGGSEALTVAGYISTPEKWIAFEEEWASFLHEFNLPFFHMADFCNGAPPYDQWSEDEKRIRYYRLVEIIRRHTYGSIGSSVLTSRLRAVLSPAAARTAGGAYGVAAHSCIIATARMVRECSPGGMVAYVMEKGAKGAGEVLRQYQENERTASVAEALRFLSLRFEDKRRFLPLQAADILAYELYRYALRKAGVIFQFPRHNLQLLRFGDMDWAVLNDEELKVFELVASHKSEELDRILKRKQARRKRKQERGRPHS